MPARKALDPVVVQERKVVQTIDCIKGRHIVTTNYGFHKEFTGKSFNLSVSDSSSAGFRYARGFRMSLLTSCKSRYAVSL